MAICWVLSHYWKTVDAHHGYIEDLVLDCSNSIANALELLQSCTEPMNDIIQSYIFK